MGSSDSDMLLRGQPQLRIADIINSHGGRPVSLSQIASGIDSSNVDIAFLARIMRFLVRKGIFTAHEDPSQDGVTLYGLTETSKWILHDSDLSLAPMLLMENHPWLEWRKLLAEGGFPRYKIIKIPALPSIIEAYTE
ncbi:hypothetical protein Tsubulata_020016, partial [Turnera subulata]